ncbi:MAG: hypothetical protein ACHQRM_13920 [Bacteroidia bacterium]
MRLVLLLINLLCSIPLLSQVNVSHGGFKHSPPSDPMPPGMLRYLLTENEQIKNSRYKDSLPLHSFYISSYEESNGQYLAWLSFLKQHHEDSAYIKALPDTLFWKNQNLPDSISVYLSRHYLHHPVFANYPALGLTPEQIKRYSVWKTDRLNEMILIHEGILEFVENDTARDFFRTDWYLPGKSNRSERSLDSVRRIVGKSSPMFVRHSTKRNVKMEDGILLPYYVLPTIQEWKYAVNSGPGPRKKAAHKAVKMKRKQYDPKGYFYYLFPSETKQTETSIHKQLRKLGIIPVQEEMNGDCLLCNIDRSVSEWVEKQTELSVLNSGIKYLRIHGPPFGNQRQLSNLPYSYHSSESITGFRLVLPDYRGEW